MKRIILLIIDSLGIGASEDCLEYNDPINANTIVNVADYCNGLNLPNFEKLGLGNLKDIKGVNPIKVKNAKYGIMSEKSKGKCTTTGHWEIAGVIVDKPFDTFPDGFPNDFIDEFINLTRCKGTLGNIASSGTEIIEKFNLEHTKTHYPIVYTSADSVFQIAVNIDVISLQTLYSWCEIARKILNEKFNVSRVIARPYKIIDSKPTRLSKYRKDYSLKPIKKSILDKIIDRNGCVLGIGKIEDIFVGCGISHSIHTSNNMEGLQFTLDSLDCNFDLNKYRIKSGYNPLFNYQLIFTNLVDTDMLYGHRNDPIGYKGALEEIDKFLPNIINKLSGDDLLIITGDHGCDPTIKGTDHTRENVPLFIYNKNFIGQNLGLIYGFDYVAFLIENWFNLDNNL